MTSQEKIVKPNIFNLLKLLGAIKILEFKYKYDSADQSCWQKELTGPNKYEEANNIFIQSQQTAASMIQQVKPNIWDFFRNL